jgi:hypothetical protein
MTAAIIGTGGIGSARSSGYSPQAARFSGSRGLDRHPDSTGVRRHARRMIDAIYQASLTGPLAAARSG